VSNFKQADQEHFARRVHPNHVERGGVLLVTVLPESGIVQLGNLNYLTRRNAVPRQVRNVRFIPLPLFDFQAIPPTRPLDVLTPGIVYILYTFVNRRTPCLTSSTSLCATTQKP
jgi:hypothetical protein